METLREKETRQTREKRTVLTQMHGGLRRVIFTVSITLRLLSERFVVSVSLVNIEIQ